MAGFRAEKIEALGYQVFHNRNYETSNMVASLFSARAFLESVQTDLLISYGDIVYQRSNLDTVLNTDGDIVVMVDDGWLDLWSVRNENPLDDAETLKFNSAGNIIEIGKKPNNLADIEGQYTGLIKISKHKIKDLIEFYDGFDRTLEYDNRTFEQMHMTSFLQMLIDSGWKIQAAHC